MALVGSALVLLVALIYASAGLDISTPLPSGVDIAATFFASPEALASARRGTVIAGIAGQIGLVADFPLIGGGLLLAMSANASAMRRLFWLWISLSTLLFIVVDLLAGFVMLPAFDRQDEAVYFVVRAIYDAAFVTGVAVFGFCLVAGWRAADWPVRPRLFSLFAGLMSLGTVLLHVAGITVPLLFGASVGLAAATGVLFAIIELKTASQAKAIA